MRNMSARYNKEKSKRLYGKKNTWRNSNVKSKRSSHKQTSGQRKFTLMA